MIDMKCPQCGQELHIDEKYAGKSGQCQYCKQRIRVPSGNVWHEVPTQPDVSGGGGASLLPPAIPKRRSIPRPLEVFFMIVGMITCAGAVGFAGLFVLGIALVAQSPEMQEMQEMLEVIEDVPVQTRPTSIPAARVPQKTRTETRLTPNGSAGLSKSNSIERQIREFAAREYPNDSQMQNYVYNQQLAGMRYMTTVTDQEVRQIAVREYPNDYSMQKYIYDNSSRRR